MSISSITDGDVAILRIHRPPVNAIDLDLLRALIEAIEECRDGPATSMVLAGEGTAFSAGLDLKAVPAYTAAQRREMVQAINRLVLLLYGLPVPTVAALNGHALGGGLVLALACDARLCTRAVCRLGLPEVAAGVPFPAGALEVVDRELSPSAKRRLVLSGCSLDPRQALEWEVVDELHDPDHLLHEAIAQARALSEPAGYAVVKRQLRREALEKLERLVEDASDPLLAPG